MANIRIFEINEDGELMVNDPELANALQELTPQELQLRGAGIIDVFCPKINLVKGCGAAVAAIQR